MMLPIKLISRYVLLSLLVFIINFFRLSFGSIILLETGLFLILCIYLDYIAPSYNKIKYYDYSKNESNTVNSITLNVCVNTITNYSIYIGFLWLTINNNQYYELTPKDMMIHNLISLPFGFILGIMSGFIFYYTHRLFHTKYLYGYFHKKHHTYNNPSSFVAIYASPIEFIFSNSLSLFAPYFILNLVFNIHPYFIIGYTFIGMLDVFMHHTSYYFKNKLMNELFGGSHFHHIHHFKYKYNYGLNNGLFDKIHNTIHIN